jgi:uncharacterized protein (TIGR03437 family)
MVESQPSTLLVASSILVSRSILLILCTLPLTVPAQSISFRPPIALTSGGASVVSNCSSCIVIADFNGDNKPDIAFNIGTPVPQGGVLLGNGDGTFRSALPLSFPANLPFASGDFNGDGKPDLVFGEHATSVYLGNGDGTFALPIPVPGCQSTTRNVAIQLADFNRDGKTDILCGTSLLLSNGDGTFRDTGAVVTQPLQSAVLIADFNRDGIPDLLLLQLNGHLSVRPGNGDATFRSELPLTWSLPPQTSPGFLTGDFNHDGNPDLIRFSNRPDRIDFLPGNGDGTFGTPVPTDLSANPPRATMSATGDFNNDGNLDFVAEDSIYAGNGDGTFRFPVFFGPTATQCGTPTGLHPAPFCDYLHGSVATGDLNGDGLPDLVTYIVMTIGMNQIKSLTEVNVLLNDSPGNGITATGVSAATATWPVGPGSIVSAYGTSLAPQTAVATTNPAPTTLGGIRLHVRDRSHPGALLLAPLLYVSPTQINYILNSSDPWAWVDIERIDIERVATYTPHGMTVPIVPLAPGFFSVPYTTSAPGWFSLYGTGFAQASASASNCTVGNVQVPVTYAGPEIQIAGLDQVNLFLPASLAGAGLLPVSCLFQTPEQVGGTTNTVNVTIR